MLEDEKELSRRIFIKRAAVAFGTIALCSWSGRLSAQTTADAGSGSDYYTSQKAKLLDQFGAMRKHVRPLLVSSYGETFSAMIDAGATREFEAILPAIPYIGGDANDLTDEMIQSAMALALYRAMSAQGKTVEETGELLYRTVEAMVNAYPAFLTRALGFYQMSFLSRRKVQSAAIQSQKRLYPSDWLYEYVEGDGNDFDWGINYHECGIVKFFRAQGAAELAPYMCLADFPMSKAFGTGLLRTTTIAEGADKCDFRFKRGRETRQGWPPLFMPSGYNKTRATKPGNIITDNTSAAERYRADPRLRKLVRKIRRDLAL